MKQFYLLPFQGGKWCERRFPDDGWLCIMIFEKNWCFLTDDFTVWNPYVIRELDFMVFVLIYTNNGFRMEKICVLLLNSIYRSRDFWYKGILFQIGPRPNII